MTTFRIIPLAAAFVLPALAAAAQAPTIPEKPNP